MTESKPTLSFVERARRLARLAELDAPQLILEHEVDQLSVLTSTLITKED